LSRSLGIAAALVVCAGTALGDGGRLRAYGDAGDFRVAVFTRPEPLTVGPVDVSVLVQERSSGEAVLNAVVAVELSGPNGVAMSAPAGRHTTNRLFYGATVDLAPGAWIVTARIRRGDAAAESRATFAVGEAGARPIGAWPYLAVPPLAVALYAANRGLRRRNRKRRSA
jgi:hypothetical protein